MNRWRDLYLDWWVVLGLFALAVVGGMT